LGRAFAEAHEYLKDLAPTGGQCEDFFQAALAAIVAPGVAAREAARDKLLEALAGRAAAADFRFISWAALTSGGISATCAALASACSSGRSTRPRSALGRASSSQVTLGRRTLETCFSRLLVRCR
jgi:hypothetical protein